MPPANTSSIYGRRDLDRGSSRVRSYGNDHSTGGTTKGMADEAVGNVKQAAGSVFGNDNLKRDGIEQERRGESELGKGPDRS